MVQYNKTKLYHEKYVIIIVNNCLLLVSIKYDKYYNSKCFLPFDSTRNLNILSNSPFIIQVLYISVTDEQFKYPMDITQVAAESSGKQYGLWRFFLNVHRAKFMNVILYVYKEE